jgi:uncharacterized protein (DUF433 family)
MVPKELEGVLVSTPDTLSGAVRFAGTRVPVQALLDTVAAGESLEEFYEGWPDVTPEQAKAVIDCIDQNKWPGKTIASGPITSPSRRGR